MNISFWGEILLISLPIGIVLINILKSLETLTLRGETLVSVLRKPEDTSVKEEITTFLLMIFVFGFSFRFGASWLLGLGIVFLCVLLFRYYQVNFVPALYCTFDQFECTQSNEKEIVNMRNMRVMNNHKNTIILSAVKVDMTFSNKEETQMVEQVLFDKPVILTAYSSHSFEFECSLTLESVKEAKSWYKNFIQIFRSSIDVSDARIKAVTQYGEVDVKPIFKPNITSVYK